MTHGRLCLCLTETTTARDLASLDRYRGSVDLAELRVDCLAPGELEAAATLPARAGVPVILAVRRASEGGGWRGPEAERVAVLRRLAGRGFAWVELEEDLPIGAGDLGLGAGVGIIRCLHDTAGVPSDLAERIVRLVHRTNELPKAAVRVRGSADLRQLVRAARATAGLQKILVGTGEAGFATGVLAARLGSMLCYASAEAAAGQADPEELQGLYRFSSIGPETAVCAVVGDPISHSLSPVIHNRAMAQLGLDAVYVPFLVDDLGAFLDAAEAIGVRGISVTAPHKEAALRAAASVDPLADRVGACNTLVRGPGGWRGANTDVEGFLSPLRAALPRLQGLRATVIGAGGAARAVVCGLVREGVDTLVLNRTPGRARELAERFGASWGGLDADGWSRMAGFADLVVQTTTSGTTAAAGQDPAAGYRYTGREVAYDLVYAPRRTPFLERAVGAGCRIIPGIEMLLGQALEQFRLFTGHDFPADLRERLARRLAVDGTASHPQRA